MLLPLKILRFFESPLQRQTGQKDPLQESALHSKDALTWPQIERRKNDKRLSTERRQQQLPVLLNTRKIQGRRYNRGRRSVDKTQDSTLHISIKG